MKLCAIIGIHSGCWDPLLSPALQNEGSHAGHDLPQNALAQFSHPSWGAAPIQWLLMWLVPPCLL